MATDTEIVRAINEILDDYTSGSLDIRAAIVRIARCSMLRDVS